LFTIFDLRTYRKDEGIRSEYDFAKMKGGVRGKYAKRYRAWTNVVLLDPDVYKAFPTAAAVNEALRAVLRIAKSVESRGCMSRRTG
jgi:hypothetical protein